MNECSTSMLLILSAPARRPAPAQRRRDRAKTPPTYFLLRLPPLPIRTLSHAPQGGFPPLNILFSLCDDRVLADISEATSSRAPASRRSTYMYRGALPRAKPSTITSSRRPTASRSCHTLRIRWISCPRPATPPRRPRLRSPGEHLPPASRVRAFKHAPNNRRRHRRRRCSRSRSSSCCQPDG